MQRRRLRFDTIDAAIDDIDNLHACGYERLGAWDLARTCDHLTMAVRMSIDGYATEARVPWPLRLFGTTVARWTILWFGWIPRNVPLPHGSLGNENPRPEQTAVSHCIATFRELRDHDGDFYSHPIVGRLTPRQWRRYHLVHAAHHLSLLIPKTT
jgi:hypothetical protein